MKRLIRLVVSLAFLALRVPAALHAESPAEILAQSDARRTIDDMSFEVRLSAFDGSRVTDTKTLWGSLSIGSDHNRVLMYFVDPASDRGKKLLVDGDAVYLLFVRTTNPIRLSPLEVLTGQASNGDVVRTFARDYDVESMTDAMLEAAPAYHFSLAAKESVGDTSYRRVQLWVEKSSLPSPVRGVLRRLRCASEEGILQGLP